MLIGNPARELPDKHWSYDAEGLPGVLIMA